MVAAPSVRLEVDLQPEAAKQLKELANRIGGNQTTALHQAIYLANLLYGEAENGGKVIVRQGNIQKPVDLPKVNQRVAAKLEVQWRTEGTGSADSPTDATSPGNG